MKPSYYMFCFIVALSVVILIEVNRQDREYERASIIKSHESISAFLSSTSLRFRTLENRILAKSVREGIEYMKRVNKP